MVCDKCGAQLKENAKFCTGCGASVTAAESVPAPEQKKSGMKPLLIVLIVLAAVILIVLIVVACLLLDGRDRQPANNGNDLEIPDGSFSVIIGPDGEYIVIGGEEGYVSGENPVPEGNPYRDYYNSAAGFILPDSAERYYARADLENLSPNARKLAFHEILARRGYDVFEDHYIQEYFDAMPWYEHANASFTLNDYEYANAVLLEVMVREQEGTLSELNNPYLIYRGDSQSEIVYDSADRYLHADDLEQLTLEELAIRRAEILARHGVIFQDQQLHQFFSCKRWYVPAVEEDDFDLEEHLNDYEACNIQLIQLYMDILSGEYTPSADNKYVACYDPNREEILPQSATVELTYADLRGLTKEELAIARNEIICRHGYVCGRQELVEYFLLCSWYRPSYAPLRSDLVDMTLLEYKNMETIYNYEKDPTLGQTPDLGEQDDSLTYFVQTDWFSVYMPAYWREYASVEVSNEDGESRISVYEKPDYQQYGVGHLFTIFMKDPAEEYDYYPQYKDLGVYSNGEYAFRLIVLYPSDVQFSDENRLLYTEMTGQIGKVLKTLQIEMGGFGRVDE